MAVDVQDPAHPFIVGRAATAGLATGVRLEGNLAHVSVTKSALGAFSLCVPPSTRTVLGLAPRKMRGK